MTALVPTIGHKALIDFGAQYVATQNIFPKYKSHTLHVIVSGRSFEPIALEERCKALRLHYSSNIQVVIHSHLDDAAPQNPSTPGEWAYWKNVIKQFHGTSPIISSESYGKKLVSLFGDWDFVPFDEPRGIVPVKGSDVRKYHQYDNLLPEIKHLFQRKYTLFGQESVGKTTLTNELKNDFFEDAVSFLQEYARPYLEYKDNPQITDQIMKNIFIGQYSLQMAAYKQGKEYFIQDTDLLSTIGYWLLWNPKARDLTYWPYLMYLFERTKSNMYFLMSPEGVPFEPDPLRYGGDKRETEMFYWEDLLKEFNCNYTILEGSVDDRVREFINFHDKNYETPWTDLKSFVRE